MPWPSDELTCDTCHTVYHRVHYELNRYMNVIEGGPCPEKWSRKCKGQIVGASSAESGPSMPRGSATDATSVSTSGSTE